MRILALGLLLGVAHGAPLADALYPKGAPPQLRVLVLTLDAAGQTIARDTIGNPASTDWWPASSIKIFAAIGALEAVEALGFGPKTVVEFARTDRRPYVRRLDWLVGQALTQSSNLAYDRLVHLAGSDALHADLLGPARGLSDTALQVPYSSNVFSLLQAPEITLTHKARRHVIPALQGQGTSKCAAATCTSLNSLAEAMRRVMLHETLPASDKLRLSAGSIAVLRRALAGKRKRGREVVQALKRTLPRARIYHKPGYYPRWRSDVLFVDAGKRRWIIALANAGGRAALNTPAKRLARWLARQPTPRSRDAGPAR